MITLFHMWVKQRENLISDHMFYVDQAQVRLLSQFCDIEKEADSHGEQWLEAVSSNFDPDRHEPSDFYEQAHEKSYDHYHMLDDMRNRTRLSVIAGLYHEWDKRVRDWMIQEMRHWHNGDEAKKAIWKVNIGDIMDLFEGLNWKVKPQGYYSSLDRCRLVVNAYKHGDGSAFQNLKTLHPEFINNPSGDPLHLEYVDHRDLLVEENHIAEFSKAIIDFWNDVPEYIYDRDAIRWPKWFESAMRKDLGTP